MVDDSTQYMPFDGSRTLRIADGEIHVWRVALNTTAVEEQSARHLLSPDETARCNRFKFPYLQRRYAVARAALRRILASILDCAPDEIQFTYGPQDKPALADTSSGLQFNVSHSEDLALIAVGRCEALGVDLEIMKPDRACRQIAERFFAPEEIDALDALAGGAYTEAFYRCWTRKEAFVKALGGGLSISLRSFAVSLDKAPRLIRLDTPNDTLKSWQLFSTTPSHEFAAAIAARNARNVYFWNWRSEQEP